uniref:Large ribosomal subunit protein uL5c n=1 Tax=Discoplastis spathirhyncha TaxID=215771 RepID=A0A3G3LLC2_9EUGL|nr:ribosomal protein L5 [Discoplastis spathirhyncha]AYQ93499.1 ribosomal protein L5 [Discoplastis spathirhyncha]
MQRLKSFYLDKVVALLIKEFGYSNLHQVPKLRKIVINRGFDESCQNSKILDFLMDELTSIAGQRVFITRAKKSIASFKVRENMPVGMSVTLRGEKMYAFLDRLVNLALPRIRDFQGVSKKSFDGFGNYSLGLNEQLMFPEVDFDKISKIQGMDINIVTSSKTDKESFFLLRSLGMPFKN